MRYSTPWGALVVAMLLISSCTTTREVYVPVVSNRSHTITVRDTVIVTQTVADSVSVFTADTTSTLRTSRATSTASIISGRLYHSLYQPPHADSVPVSLVEHHTVDSISYPVYVDRVEERTVIPPWMTIVVIISVVGLAIMLILFFAKR